MTSRLETGKSRIFFYSVPPSDSNFLLIFVEYGMKEWGGKKRDRKCEVGNKSQGGVSVTAVSYFNLKSEVKSDKSGSEHLLVLRLFDIRSGSREKTAEA